MANYLLFENGNQIDLENNSGQILLETQATISSTPLSSFNYSTKSGFISTNTIGGTVLDDVNS